jgi:hypothetical protein
LTPVTSLWDADPRPVWSLTSTREMLLLLPLLCLRPATKRVRLLWLALLLLSRGGLSILPQGLLWLL